MFLETKTNTKRQQLQEAKKVFLEWLNQNHHMQELAASPPRDTCTLMEDSLLHYVNRVRGLGFKDKQTAEIAIKNLEGRDPDYQKLAVNGLLNSAKVMLRKTKNPEKITCLNQAVEVFLDYLEKLKYVNQPTCRYLPATIIDKFPPPTDELQKEFITTYKYFKDFKKLRSRFPDGKYEKTWDIVRNKNLWRIIEDFSATNEQLWLETGAPSELHLRMIHWAYSPEPIKVREYVDGKF